MSLPKVKWDSKYTKYLLFIKIQILYSLNGKDFSYYMFLVRIILELKGRVLVNDI
jgi:hypothetical protein